MPEHPSAFSFSSEFRSESAPSPIRSPSRPPIMPRTIAARESTSRPMQMARRSACFGLRALWCFRTQGTHPSVRMASALRPRTGRARCACHTGCGPHSVCRVASETNASKAPSIRLACGIRAA
eukprot:2814748-Rhodomonas_salina.1